LGDLKRAVDDGALLLASIPIQHFGQRSP